MGGASYMPVHQEPEGWALGLWMFYTGQWISAGTHNSFRFIDKESRIRTITANVLYMGRNFLSFQNVFFFGHI